MSNKQAQTQAEPEFDGAMDFESIFAERKSKGERGVEVFVTIPGLTLPNMGKIAAEGTKPSVLKRLAAAHGGAVTVTTRVQTDTITMPAPASNYPHLADKTDDASRKKLYGLRWKDSSKVKAERHYLHMTYRSGLAAQVRFPDRDDLNSALAQLEREIAMADTLLYYGTPQDLDRIRTRLGIAKETEATA